MSASGLPVFVKSSVFVRPGKGALVYVSNLDPIFPRRARNCLLQRQLKRSNGVGIDDIASWQDFRPWMAFGKCSASVFQRRGKPRVGTLTSVGQEDGQ